MISLLCPTRKRPHRLREMIASARATEKNKNQILCYVTNDDDSYNNFTYDLLTEMIRGERVTFSALWNQLLPFTQGDIFMLCADDVIFRTPGWDVIVEEAYAKCDDKILCVFGDDGGPNGKRFASLPFVSRRWVEIACHFTPDGYTADYCDTHIQDIAEMLGRKMLLPIVTEHVHWLWNKAQKDEVYRENLERNARDNNPARYMERLPERRVIAEKLAAEIMRVKKEKECAAQS